MVDRKLEAALYIEIPTFIEQKTGEVDEQFGYDLTSNIAISIFAPRDGKGSDGNPWKYTVESGGDHEEGYFITYREYTVYESKVYMSVETHSLDCDGRMDRYHHYVWDEENQNWDMLDSRQRDHSAEQMGY